MRFMAKAASQRQRQEMTATLLQVLGKTTAIAAELDAIVPAQVWYQSLFY